MEVFVLMGALLFLFVVELTGINFAGASCLVPNDRAFIQKARACYEHLNVPVKVFTIEELVEELNLSIRSSRPLNSASEFKRWALYNVNK